MEKKTIMMKKFVLMFAAALAVFFVTSTNAFAGGNDFKLARFCNGNTGCTSDQSVSDFKTFSKAYSSILAPMHFQPARTLGEEGFEIGVDFGEACQSFLSVGLIGAVGAPQFGDGILSLIRVAEEIICVEDIARCVDVCHRNHLP